MEEKNFAWNENLSKRCNHPLLRVFPTDEITDKSDVECNLYQWAEGVPD